MYESDFSDKMHQYFYLLCFSSRNFLYGLKLFSEGIGYQQAAMMIEFPDDPDIDDRYKDLASGCVGFYNDDDPPPLFVPIKDFLDYLKSISEKYLSDKDPAYREQAQLYLRGIYERYSPDKKICVECGSEYLASASKMMELCPECASVLYGYDNCKHIF